MWTEVVELFEGRRQPRDVSYSGGTPDAQPSALRDPAAAAAAAGAQPAQAAGNGQGEPPQTGTIVKSEREKLGRNDPCWCGSGKKFKNCHGR